MNAVATVDLHEQPIDFGLPFIPETLTPLAHTAAWQRLEAPHRLRYNQLQALFFNEQIVFFETRVGTGIMQALLQEGWQDDFDQTLREFWEDEVRHTGMFRALNRRCAPELYATDDFHFIQVPRPWVAILQWTTRRPRLFALYIWLMLLQEERSLYYSAQFIRHKETVESHFVATYRAHLVDEAGHVRWDQELLHRWWPRVRPRLRRVNARLLGWLVDEFFSTPRRGQISVLDTLGREFPELEPQLPELKRQTLALTADPRYRRSMYSREVTPRSFALFDQWPEFRVLERAMPGYRYLGGLVA